MTISAIIVAGGQGKRMKSAQLKQYLQLGDLPIICHSLMRFVEHKSIDEIVLVIPPADIDYCRSEILAPLNLYQTVQLIKGGKERQDSVFNGLAALSPRSNIVIIHDAVRPFVENKHISACIEGAMKYGACTLGLAARETLKRVSPDGFIGHAVERENVWHIQTPQAFKTELLRKAHAKANQDGFLATDDTSLLERLGEKVKVIPGKSTNIKITTPEDLQFAKGLLNLN